MATDNLPDLNQIHIVESLFLACQISNSGPITAFPEQIDAFTSPAVSLIPMIDLDQNKVNFDIRVQVAAIDAEGQILQVDGAFRIFISFHVVNLPELVYFNEQLNQKIPIPHLTNALVGVAYSTARGMIMSKVADTVLAGLSLPLRSNRRLMEESQPLDVEGNVVSSKETEAPTAPQKEKAPTSKKA